MNILVMSFLRPPIRVFRKCLRRLFQGERGQVLAIVALGLPAIMGMGALAVDLGHYYTAKGALQNAIDSAALAGASGLGEGTSTARGRAIQYAQANQVAQQAVVLESDDIEFGTYDSQTGVFEAGSTGINALRVKGDAVVPLYFASIFGFEKVTISAQAIAGLRSGGCGPIFGDEKVVVSGSSITDSYDSNSGVYVSSAAGDKGSICSNGPITLSGNITINGNATPGPESEVTLSGQATVTGSTSPASTAFTVPTIDMGSAGSVNDNNTIGLTSSGKNPLDSSNDFSISGQDTITLNSGVYYFKSVSMSGGSEVRINASSGPVVIFVTDSLSVSGQGFLNLSAIPADLQIFVTGSSANYSGGSDFFGVILAPAASLTISGNAGYFGAAIANDVTLSGEGAIHYDEALESTNLVVISETSAFLGG